MKLFIASFLGVLSLNAEPVVEVFPALSSLCRNQEENCPASTRLHFTDQGACACLSEGTLTHPRKCMIGPMYCDVKDNQRYQWFYRFSDDLVEKIMTGCACVKER